MQYSLGNMLKGGGALNPDGLALDLAFALDRSFTTDPAAAGNALITSRRGPAAKFSRGSGATQVNAAGLIEYAPENLMTRSEEFDHSGWIKLRSSVDDNATTDPAGTLNADKLIEDSSTGTHMTYRTAVLSSLVPHTFSVYAKADGRDFMYLQCGDGFPVNCHAYFDLSAGTKGTVGVNATANIEPAGNGWYRCSVTATPSSLTTNIFYIQPTAVNGSTSYAGDGASGIYLWGAQVERASTARTYYPTTTAAFHGPRFDHDPATGVCKGLLIEESRENLITRSEEFEHSNWAKTNISVSQDSIVAPTGSSTADLLQSVATSSSNVFASVVATATTATYSIYTKKGNVSTRFFLLRNSTTATNFQLGTINYDTATISGAGWTIQTLPNGWYRIAFTQSTGITSGDTLLAYCGMKGDVDTAGSTWSVWGAQLEAGAFATSYIPTTSGTLQRSADVCSIIGDAFASFYNQSEGTLFYSPSIANLTGVNRGIVQIDNGANVHMIRNYYDLGFKIEVSANDTKSVLINVAGASNVAQKLAISQQGTLFNAVANGGTISTVTRTAPVGLNALRIGNLVGGSFYINGHIARIQYFRKRLSNAKLQTLTAP